MEKFNIIYAVIATTMYLIIAKYDIHMFQLNSYRYSRYFRWLAPKNIVSTKRVFALIALLSAFLPDYYDLGCLSGVTTIALIHALREKFKTPLVYTKRVKRLFATDIILFIIIEVIAMLFAGEWANAVIGSTRIMHSANNKLRILRYA